MANDILARDRDEAAVELREEVARLRAVVERLVNHEPNLTVARFVVSDHEAGLPVARSTLDAAQRALGLPAIDD